MTAANGEVEFGDLPTQTWSLDFASRVVKKWRAKAPAQFGKIAAEAYMEFALEGMDSGPRRAPDLAEADPGTPF